MTQARFEPAIAIQCITNTSTTHYASDTRKNRHLNIEIHIQQVRSEH